jgi:hypothetical protein
VSDRYQQDMSQTIHLRHVPDDLFRKLKSRAALEGLTLSGYLLKEFERLASYPSLAELHARIASRKPFHPRVSPAQLIRSQRGRPRP